MFLSTIVVIASALLHICPEALHCLLFCPVESVIYHKHSWAGAAPGASLVQAAVRDPEA